MSDMTQDELDRLSPEERAAMGGDEDERRTLEEIIEDVGDADGKDADAEGDENGGEDAGTQAQADDASAGEEADDDARERPFVPTYEAQGAENLDEQLAALNEQRTQIAQSFNDGDINSDEMLAQFKALDAERDRLTIEKAKASVFEDMGRQQAAQAWQWEVQRFMRDAKKNEGIDYADAKNAHLNKFLDSAVKLLANDPDNAERDSEWFLQEAHRMTKARYSLGAVPSQAAPRPAASATRRPDLRSVPPSLSSVPNAGADDASTGESEFGYLEKLSGLELEAELARMSPAKQERYLRSA